MAGVSIAGSLRWLADYLERHPFIRILALSGVVMAPVLLGFQLYSYIYGSDQDRINRAYDILAKAQQGRGADIGQRAALELLHRKEKLPQPVVMPPNAPLQGLDLPPTRSRSAPKGAKLATARFPGAILEHAKLRCADLWHADLRRAFLTDAKLQHARLFGAKLQGADLEGADIAGADLLIANLSGADFLRVKGATREQLSKACADPNRPPRNMADSIRPAAPWPQPCPPWDKNEPVAPPMRCPK